MLLIKAKILPYGEKVCSERTNAANECAMIYSNIVTDRFLSTNVEAQNYFFKELSELANMQQNKGVTSAWSVSHQSSLEYNVPQSLGIVDKTS